MSTYKSNLQQAMSDNLLSLIQNADSREIIYPVFSFKRDTEKRRHGGTPHRTPMRR